MSIKNVTERNTKKDIYAAYRAALQQVKDSNEASPDRRRSFQQTENAKILKMTTETSPESIVKELGEFRLKTNEAISGLEDQMVAKKQKLEQIQTAIGLTEAELKNVHGIVKEADSLAALVNSQEDAREEFRAGKAEEQEVWVAETERHEASVVERDRLVDQQRKRDAEAYAFNLGVQRRNDNDKWAQEKVAREENVGARETAMTEKEKHLAELETAVAGHETAVQVAVTAAVEVAAKKAETAHGFAKRALESKANTAEQISTMKIEGLEAKVKDLVEANTTLQTKLTEATSQVQDIATQAIKGAQARIVPVTTEPVGKR